MLHLHLIRSFLLLLVVATAGCSTLLAAMGAYKVEVTQLDPRPNVTLASGEHEPIAIRIAESVPEQTSVQCRPKTVVVSDLHGGVSAAVENAAGSRYVADPSGDARVLELTHLAFEFRQAVRDDPRTCRLVVHFAGRWLAEDGSVASERSGIYESFPHQDWTYRDHFEDAIAGVTTRLFWART